MKYTNNKRGDILFNQAKKGFILIFILVTLFFLSSCENVDVGGDGTGEYQVTFVINDSFSVTKKSVNKKAINEKELIPNQFRYNFKGWLLNGEPFNFNTKLTKNITLNASYNDKYENLVREIRIHINNPNEMSLWNIDKKTDLEAVLKVLDDNFNVVEHEIEIRGRGNSTWINPKKPYRIEFSDATSLFGMKKAKLYVLLADYNDPSGLRNYLAHEFSKMLNIGYKLETRHVEVYINDEPMGMYLLTEQVQIYKNRLNIEMNDNPESGFLIELEADERMEGEGDEDFNWVKVNGRNFLIKYPKDKDHTEADYRAKAAYIKNYLTEMNASFYNGTYEDYLDVEQFIDYFILQEIFKNVDVNFSSVFAYKAEGELLKMGPLWDFDISLGNGNYFNYHYYGFHAVYHPWLNALLKDEIFVTRYVARFREVLENYIDDLILLLLNKAEILEEYFIDDNDLWHTFGRSYWPVTEEMAAKKTHHEYVELIKDFLLMRKQWLLNNLDQVNKQ